VNGHERNNSDNTGYRSGTVIDYLFAFISAALFGSISTVAKPTLSSTIHPLVLSAMVYLIAAVVMSPIAHRNSSNNSERGNNTLLLKRRDYLYIIAIAILGAVMAPTLYFIGLEQTTASNAAILSNAEIVFTLLIAVLFFREKIKPVGYVGVLLVLFAVIIITTNQNLQPLSSLSKINYGDLLVVASTLFWGIDNNISKIVSHKIHNTGRIVQLKSFIGGLLLMVIVLTSGIQTNINLTQIPNIILLGAGGFGMSIFLFLHSLKRIGTVRTIIIFSTSSIFGVIFSMTFLNEQLHIFQLMAIPVMIFGIYLVNRKNNEIIIS
jgi:drug/metabolite transporter (DMT)-like permease